MNCRHCENRLEHTFLDLGFAPPSNAYLSSEDLAKPELYFPLKLKVCENCWLVQTLDYASADQLFREDYAYFSSVSTSWLAHAKRYSDCVIERFNLNANSLVIEVASNDGYLLKNFLHAGIPCLGIEPTLSTATAAESIGIPVIREFFGESLALKLKEDGKQADLIVGNNVYAHVPDINDFTNGLREALKPQGLITLEFPHLMNLLEYNQFDTVYHEHFSYLSLHTVKKIFESCGLRIFDVDQLPTHGGSIRIYGCHVDSKHVAMDSVEELLALEARKGLQSLNTYLSFQSRADLVKNELLGFLIDKKRSGKKVVAYGAAAKGNTLLNYAGVKPDLLPFVVDAAASKQGKFMPGSHIPIICPSRLLELQPDYVLILPWNIVAEVLESQQNVREAGAQFFAAIPNLRFV